MTIKCLDTADLLDFLSRLEVPITAHELGLIVHALAGDVAWQWFPAMGMWCHV